MCRLGVVSTFFPYVQMRTYPAEVPGMVVGKSTTHETVTSATVQLPTRCAFAYMHEAKLSNTIQEL